MVPRVFTLAVVLLVLVSTTVAVSASLDLEIDESKPVGKAISLVKSVLARVLSLIKSRLPESITSNTTTTTLEECPIDYIRVGVDCCLDENGNSICDDDEEVTTTSVSVTTTTEPTTTVTTTSTTTTTAYVECHSLDDCGETRTEYRCSGDNIMRVVYIPSCRNAGTPDAQCTSIAPTPRVVATCSGSKQCVNGYEECQLEQ